MLGRGGEWSFLGGGCFSAIGELPSSESRAAAMERRAAAMDERVAASLLALKCSLEETPACGAQIAARASRARRRLCTSDSSSDSSVAGGIDRERPL